jgi:cell division protein FtsQ
VTNVAVSGNSILTAQEVEAASGVGGVNILWIRQADIVSRLKLLPPVESASSSLSLPNSVSIRVSERQPVAIWVKDDVPFLVDAEGLVLAARPADRELMVIRDTSPRPVGPGSRVDAQVVRTLPGLDRMLNAAFGAQDRRYEYAQDTGLTIIPTGQPRLLFGTSDDLEWKVSAVQSIVQHLQSSRAGAELIDVRFSDRAYYR